MIFRDAFLTPNQWSRPGGPLKSVRACVVHYLQAPGWTEQRARDYFESLADGHEKAAKGCHYVCGPTEVLYIIPRTERAYHCGSGEPFPQGYTRWAIHYFGDYPNDNSIGIECCHPDATGRFEAATIANLTELCALVCARHGLDPMTQLVRHHDVTGKACPLWYVEHPDEWGALKASVAVMAEDMRKRGALWLA